MSGQINLASSTNQRWSSDGIDAPVPPVGAEHSCLISRSLKSKITMEAKIQVAEPQVTERAGIHPVGVRDKIVEARQITKEDFGTFRARAEILTPAHVDVPAKLQIDNRR